jgi:polyphosphate kinase 2
MAKDKSKTGSKGKKKAKADDKAEQKKAGKLSNKEYEAEIYKLHAELVKLQYWIKDQGLRIIVVFEGRDAAGKGGVIKRITERVSPRVFRVVALPAPNEREKGEMYAQRYLTQFPTAGEVVLFDRSWYNRGGVERVMGFCTTDEYKRFLHYAPIFEKMIVDSGTILVKYWFDVSMDEQERRFRARVNDPRKTWKLSPMDIESYNRWYEYSQARDDMLAATDTDFAPWYLVNADDKKRARLNCISHLLSLIPYKKIPPEKVKFGKRNMKGKYDDRTTVEDRRHIPKKY